MMVCRATSKLRCKKKKKKKKERKRERRKLFELGPVILEGKGEDRDYRVGSLEIKRYKSD